jgi:hypothetical protein
MQPRANGPEVGTAGPVRRHAADVFDETPRPRDQNYYRHPAAKASDMLPRQPEHNEAGHPVANALDRRLDGKQADPLAQAEAALRKLRANPSDKQAADALERALKQLKVDQKKRIRLRLPEEPENGKKVD